MTSSVNGIDKTSSPMRQAKCKNKPQQTKRTRQTERERSVNSRNERKCCEAKNDNVRDKKELRRVHFPNRSLHIIKPSMIDLFHPNDRHHHPRHRVKWCRTVSLFFTTTLHSRSDWPFGYTLRMVLSAHERSIEHAP